MVFDADGYLVTVAGYAPVSSNIVHVLDPNTGAIVVAYGPGWTSLPSVNGVTCDPASGDLVVVADASGVVFRAPRLGPGSYGTPVVLATGILGSASQLAVRPAVTTYGPATPGAFSYAWQTTLLPGGNPT